MFAFFTLPLVLALSARAVQITTPALGAMWSSGGGSQTVSWTAVATDPQSFTIQLVNQAGFLADSPVTLVANQSTGASTTAQSATVSYPSGSWPTGTAFQINFVTSSTNSAILAQSQQFNITSGGSSSSSSSSSSMMTAAGTTPTTLSQASSMMTTAMQSAAGSSSSTTSASGSDASGGIPNVASSSAAAGNLPIPGPFVSILIAAAGLMGVVL